MIEPGSRALEIDEIIDNQFIEGLDT